MDEHVFAMKLFPKFCNIISPCDIQFWRKVHIVSMARQFLKWTQFGKHLLLGFLCFFFFLLSIHKFLKKYMQYCFIFVFRNLICNWSTCVIGNGFNCLIKRIVCNILLTFFKSFYCNGKLKVDRVFSTLLFLSEDILKISSNFSNVNSLKNFFTPFYQIF